MIEIVIARILSAETHPDPEFSHLSVIKVLEHTAIAGKMEDKTHRYNVGSLVVVFPAGTVIPVDVLKIQGFYWDFEKNRGLLKGNKRNRVGPVIRGSVTSDCLLFPVVNNAIVNGSGNELVVLEGDIVTEFLGITEFK